MTFYKKKLNEKNTHFDDLRHEHEAWKDELQEMNKPFFMIPSDFSTLFLKDISGGALKLYLFLGFHSKYRTGESWYTNEQISLFFEKDTRTISNWFSELEKLGLIFRAQKGIMMKANTFMIPFGFFATENEIHYRSTVKQVEQYLKEVPHNIEFIQAVILNYGLTETNLILIERETTNKNIYSLISFLDMDFKDIKFLRNLFRRYETPIDTYEIQNPLSSTRHIEQAIYNNLIRFFDDKSMWS